MYEYVAMVVHRRDYVRVRVYTYTNIFARRDYEHIVFMNISPLQSHDYVCMCIVYILHRRDSKFLFFFVYGWIVCTCVQALFELKIL